MRQLKISKSITNRQTESLDKYLSEIGHEGLITAEEEVVLAQKIRKGDSKALDKLVRANLRFVISVAKQYQNQGLSLSDLINEGNLGLIKAAQRFDETRGFKFISYAVWWIRQSILQAIAEQSRIVRLPLNKIGQLNKINKTFAKLEQIYEREPSADEISETLDLSSGDITESLLANQRHHSLDAPVNQNQEDPLFNLLDTIKDDNEATSPHRKLMLESAQKDINRALDTLPKNEKKILEYYFGLNGCQPKTLDEIAFVFDLTRERIRQIKEKAVRKLKRPKVSAVLKKHL